MKNRFRFLVLITSICTGANVLIAQWVQVNNYSGSIECFAVSDTNLFVGTSNSIFLSTNNGKTWNAVNNGLTSEDITSFAVNGSAIFAATQYNGIFLSTNNGTSWTAVNFGLTNTQLLALAISRTILFAGTYGGGVFRSTNNGTNWTAVITGLTNINVHALTVIDTNIFAGTDDGVFLSTNNGTSWTAANTGMIDITGHAPHINVFAVSRTNLFVGTNNSIFLSTNNGTNWNAVNSTATPVYTFTVSGTNLFAGTDDDVYLSTDNGTNWTAVNSGLPNNPIYAITVSGTNLFAGTENKGVWMRSLSEMIPTVVKDSHNQIPICFALEQNYPNPFNPTTNISFSLPSKYFAILKVFDVLGREVATIISEELSAGNHTREWNAANMSSGIYFYCLQAGPFTETKKLVLLR